jgi:hypothetical protein
MFVGVTRGGTDEFIVCPQCKGAGEVAQYQVIDAATGIEIDYESFGRTAADEPTQGACL